MKTVLILVCIVFAVFGLGEFLHILKLFAIFPHRKLWAHLVVNLQNETAEKQTLYVCEQYIWHGENFADFIVLNADNLSRENYERCKNIADKYGIKITERV